MRLRKRRRDSQKEIGAREAIRALRALLAAHGVTDLARMMGVDDKSVARWRDRSVRPSGMARAFLLLLGRLKGEWIDLLKLIDAHDPTKGKVVILIATDDDDEPEAVSIDDLADAWNANREES